MLRRPLWLRRECRRVWDGCRVKEMLCLNEAVTQYFTNFVLQENQLGRGTGYSKEVVAGEALAQMVGHEELALGYFLGPASGVWDILRNKIPHFEQGKLVHATMDRNVNWNQIAEMILGTRPIPNP